MKFDVQFSPKTAGLGVTFGVGDRWYHVAATLEIGPFLFSVGKYDGKHIHMFCPRCFRCEVCGESQIDG